MSRRFLKKIRNFRLMSALVIASLTIVSFQNCAPAPQACADGSKNCTSSGSTNQSSTSSGGSNLWGGSGNSNGQNYAGGGGGNVNNGGSLGGGGSSGGGGIVGGGGTGGGSSGGGTGGGGTGSGGSTAFRILKDVNNMNVREGESFTLEVTITGGSSPYKFQWYKDGQPLTGALGQYSFYSDAADSYKKEGIYYAEIKDGSGQTIRSSSARIGFVEPEVGCQKGSYFTFTEANFDLGTNYFTEYFDGPRGKFLLHQSFDIQNILYSNAKYTKLSAYNVTADLPYKGSTYISCRTAIPRIHTPQPNPGGNNGFLNSGYADGNNYKYEGSVNFTCRNKKLLYQSNTCKWVYYAPPRDNGGGR